MESLYWLAALTIGLLVLAWFVYQAPRKTDLDQFYKHASEDIAAEIKAINAKFKADLDQQVLDQLAAAGISKEQVQSLSDQTMAVKSQVASLQSQVKDAAIQHLDSIQQLVDARMTQLKEFADKLEQDSASYRQQFDSQSSDIRAANAKFAGDQSQQITDLTTRYQQQLKQMFIDSKAELAATIASQQEAYKTQASDATSALNALLQKNSDILATQGKNISDAVNTLAIKQIADFNSALNTKYSSTLGTFTTTVDTQVANARSSIQTAIQGMQTTQTGFVAQFQQTLQDLIQKTQSDMQKILYGYGYRRVWNCSFYIGDNTITPTNLQGVASIVRKSAASIVIYTCTLPQTLTYDYNVMAQFMENGAEPTTLSNDFSVLVTKPIDRQTFSVGVERLGGGNTVTLAISLIEK